MFWKTSGVEKSVLSPVTTEHSVEIYLNLHCTRAASINHVKANTKKLLQIPSDPGMTRFHIHPPSRSLLCELIPLYSMCLLSFSLVRRLSPLPTLRDRVIQPEQYSNASCSHCSLGALFFFSCPPCCVCQEHSVSAPKETGGVMGEHSRTP